MSTRQQKHIASVFFWLKNRALKDDHELTAQVRFTGRWALSCVVFAIFFFGCCLVGPNFNVGGVNKKSENDKRDKEKIIWASACWFDHQPVIIGRTVSALLFLGMLQPCRSNFLSVKQQQTQVRKRQEEQSKDGIWAYRSSFDHRAVSIRWWLPFFFFFFGCCARSSVSLQTNQQKRA